MLRDEKFARFADGLIAHVCRWCGNSAGLDAGLKAAQAGDFQTALKEWKPLADQGHAYAQYYLGLMYANGEGVVEDDAEAVRWYRLAADQGLADAQVFLGLMYANGRVWRKMTPRRCAGTGWPPIRGSPIGWMYDNGEGVPEDDAEAVRWYRLAADVADAQHNLGWMYANGEGVAEDDAEAVRWYRLAADQGLADAQVRQRRGCGGR